MNTVSPSTRWNIFWSRLFVVFMLISFVLQIMIFLWVTDDPWEFFVESFARAIRRARN